MYQRLGVDVEPGNAEEGGAYQPRNNADWELEYWIEERHMRGMNRARMWVGAAMAALVVGTALGEPEKGWGEDVRRLAQPLVDGKLVPGLVVGIWDQGKTSTFAFGRVNAEKDEAPTADTVYEIGSVSKVFTAILLAEAVEHGEMKLDDPLSTLLPKDVKAPMFEGREIRLEDISTHFSGLPRLPSNMDASSLDNPYATYTREKLFEFVNGYALTRAPGEKYEYSNLAVGMLGTLLADKAKKSYESLLHDRVTGPLHMNDTTITLSEGQKARLAPGHRSGLAVSNWDLASLEGAGGIRSTVNDLLKLAAAQMEPEKSPLRGALTMVAERRKDIGGSNLGMGLGWHIAGDKSTRFHNGQTGGYSSAIFVNAGMKKGVVVLSNGADSAIDGLAENVLQTLAGMKIEPIRTRATISLTDAQIEPLLGVYQSGLGFDITVTRQGEAVLARLTGQQALRIWPETATKFFYREVVADVDFELDADGKSAKALTLHQNGRDMRCERKK